MLNIIYISLDRYKYSKDDEEIYKEFMEIANELIPHLVKTASLNPQLYREVLRAPECFSHILRFYDGICCWEEDSATPVLHIGWAKPMVSTCSKFEPEIRAKVQIPDDDDEGAAQETPGGVEGTSSNSPPTSPSSSSSSIAAAAVPEHLNNNVYKKRRSPELSSSGRDGGLSHSTRQQHFSSSSSYSRSSHVKLDGGHLPGTEASQRKDRRDRKHHRRRLRRENDCDNKNSRSSSSCISEDLLRSLSEGCKENVLNVDFLLGKNNTSPFLLLPSSEAVEAADPLERLRMRGRRRELRRLKKKRRRLLLKQQKSSASTKFDTNFSGADKSSGDAVVVPLLLHSAKMRGLKDLLCNCEKLNTSAIQLQLTAQSQTTGGGKKAIGGVGGAASMAEEETTPSGRPKRARRE